jgi:leucyl-tRNA---protein transferase
MTIFHEGIKKKITNMIQQEDYIIPGLEGFKGNLLDDYLAAGYYRMQHLLFTTHQTREDLESDPIPVFWLRMPVKAIGENKTALAIRKKCAGFSVSFKKAVITPAIDELYGLYRNHIDFNASADCSSCLHGFYLPNPFESWMVEISDHDKLIAVGYFDVGTNSLSGILNFYHPSYKKFSLGKFLMLQKIDYTIQSGRQYYYTGYISPAISKFDYKIFPDEKVMEVFLPQEKEWMPYSLFGKTGMHEYSIKHSLI